MNLLLRSRIRCLRRAYSLLGCSTYCMYACEPRSYVRPSRRASTASRDEPSCILRALACFLPWPKPSLIAVDLAPRADEEGELVGRFAQDDGEPCMDHGVAANAQGHEVGLVIAAAAGSIEPVMFVEGAEPPAMGHLASPTVAFDGPVPTRVRQRFLRHVDLSLVKTSDASVRRTDCPSAPCPWPKRQTRPTATPIPHE